MGTLWQDLRYGFRGLWRNPLFAVVAVFTLALGIGANSAIFTVVNGVLLRSLPYENEERVVWIWGRWPGGNQASVSAPDLLDYREQSGSFEQLGAFANVAIPFNLTGGGEPEQTKGYYVTANFFEALGAKPILGRSFRPEDEQAGQDRVVILSNGLWKSRFGGDPGIIEKGIKINGENYTVAGIMPPGIEFPKTAKLWVPLPLYLPEMKIRWAHSLRPIGRLKPMVTMAQAQTEMDLIAARLEKQYPETNSGWGVRLIPLREQIVGDVRLALLMLIGATAFVLLIACANVANLLLARATVRQKEMSIRAALGASRLRIIRLLFTESLLLSVIGGALGILLAFWGVKILIAMMPGELPQLNEIKLDGQVLGFTLILALLTGVVFGLAPALQSSRPDLNETLKEGGKGSGDGSRRKSLRNLLVKAEVALALVLLISSGLMIKSFFRLQEVNLGFNPQNILTMQIALPQTKYADPVQQANFYQQALQRIENLPGVQAVGTISELPLSGEASDTYFTVEAHPPADPNQKPVANYRVTAHDYFRVMGIPLLKGRYFTAQEEMGAPVIIINDAMARKYFPGEEALGKYLIVDVGEPLRAEIVGVVGNVRHFSLEAEPFDEMYLPLIVQPSTHLVVRTATDPLSLASAVRGEVRAVDKDQAVANIRTMEQIVAESLAQSRFRTVLLSIFAAIALVLAVVGIYGVMSYSVTLQTHEIGIRMALGAQGNDVLKLVVRWGLMLTLWGLAVGLVVAFALTRLMSSLLYGVSPSDWTTFSVATGLLALVALAACYLPARRASRVDPIIALRHE